MNGQPIRVLLIEDNPGDTRLIVEAFNEAGADQFELTCEENLASGLQALSRLHIDVILLDLSLPDSFGLETVGKVLTHAPDTPIVVLTGHSDDSLSVSAVQAGAQDYLIKGEMESNLLVRSLRYAIERNRMSIALKSLSLVDDLTGLYNRRGFLTLAGQQLKTAERLTRNMMLLFADLDDLKRINDSQGHRMGDQALRETADIFRRTFRQSDIMARLGGDEFVVLVMDTAEETEKRVVDRLLARVASANERKGLPYRISLSIGIAHYEPGAQGGIEELLEKADSLMYEQKKMRKEV